MKQYLRSYTHVGLWGPSRQGPVICPLGVQRGADEGLALNDPNPIVHNRIFVLSRILNVTAREHDAK